MKSSVLLGIFTGICLGLLLCFVSFYPFPTSTATSVNVAEQLFRNGY